MKFRDFLLSPLLEGGQAVKGVAKVTQAEVREAAPSLLKLIASELGVKQSMIAIIGSAGKKPDPADLSGDIDVAVQCDADVVEKALPKLAAQKKYKAMRGIGVFSFAHEVGSKLVQVDLMPVKSLKFAEWSFQANPADLKQGLKGAHRNEIFFAIAKHMPQEVTETDDDGKPLKIKRYFYDLSRGLMQGIKSRVGKRSTPNKNFSTVEKHLVTDDPTKITRLMFGKSTSPEEVSTFEGALTALRSDNFPQPDQLSNIIKTLADGIKNKGLTLPKL